MDDPEPFETRWGFIILTCLMMGLNDVPASQVTALVLCFILYRLLKPVDR